MWFDATTWGWIHMIIGLIVARSYESGDDGRA